MFTVHPNYKFKAKALGLNEKLPDRPMDAWSGQMDRQSDTKGMDRGTDGSRNEEETPHGQTDT